MASDAAGPQSSEIFKEGLFDGTTWVVTGGGTGIGLEIALQASRLGATVAICGRRQEPLEAAANLIESKTGKKIFYKTCMQPSYVGSHPRNSYLFDLRRSPNFVSRLTRFFFLQATSDPPIPSKNTLRQSSSILVPSTCSSTMVRADLPSEGPAHLHI